MAKKIKRNSFTHNNRHAAFIQELGGQPGQSFDDVMQPARDALNELTKLFIGIDTPEIEMDRERDKTLHINHLENSEELYGRTRRQTLQKYAGNVHDCKPQMGMKDCNPELSEVEQEVVMGAANIPEEK